MRTVKLLIFCLFSICFLSLNTGVYASAKTDYDFQWAKYRENYAEFNLLKRDYLQNQTLDNQQKAILSAKQSILARDMAKSAYARFLIDEINTKNTGYKDLDPILSKLDSAATYFNAQALLSQQIITPADLKNFALNYYNTSTPHNSSFFFGQVGVKIATLVRFQIDAKDGLDAMIPKLPSVKPAALQARLDNVPNLAANINSKIAAITATILPPDEEAILTEENYFNQFIDRIEEVRQLQNQMVDQFIDIDINYVQSKI